LDTYNLFYRADSHRPYDLLRVIDFSRTVKEQKNGSASPFNCDASVLPGILHNVHGVFLNRLKYQPS
jgi:hypothetical protein